MTAVVFEPPGKGGWISLRDHFPRAVTPEYADLLSTAMRAGEAIPMADYGLPVKSLMVGLVHGHVYVTTEPLVGPPTDAVPPAAALWLATRLVPAFRRRTRAARRALAERPWRADAKHWYLTERQEWIDAARALQQVEPHTLDDAELAEHLREVRSHLGAGYQRHFALHGPDLIPTGLLLARCADWGIPADAVLPVLAGASPASTGQGPALDALRQMVAKADGQPRTVEELREIAPLELAAFLADHGWRLVTGYDLDCLALIELPELIVTLACCDPTPASDDRSIHRAARTSLAASVPAADLEELDRLVDDARATIGVRDDNGAVTAAWPAGLLRRAMLEGGRRLAGRGALADPDHALEVTVSELRGLLTGSSTRTADEISERASDRRARSALAPPLTLGPELDIPVAPLPAPMRLISRAQLALRDTFTAPPTHRAGLDGEGIGQTVFRGRACVAIDPADALTRLEPGDVLVAVGTTPAFNLALSIAGAVVVEEGGLLSHAAVIARELDLPAIIGATGAMTDIPDGALIEVDPAAGQVRVIATA